MWDAEKSQWLAQQKHLTQNFSTTMRKAKLITGVCSSRGCRGLRFAEVTSSPKICISQNTLELHQLPVLAAEVPGSSLSLFQKHEGGPAMQSTRRQGQASPADDQDCSGDRGASPRVTGVAVTAHRQQVGGLAGGKEAQGPRGGTAGQVWREGAGELHRGCGPGCVPLRPSEAGDEYDCPEETCHCIWIKGLRFVSCSHGASRRACAV